MSGDWRAGFGQFAYALALGAVTIPYWSSMVSAQIIPDDTLGAESSVVTPDNIKGIESESISGGAVRGSNLFHSFREFNIGEGKGGYFENPAAIENIFSRVTGSNPSEILGTLGVLGNANLFFLNPNGIIFGPNASLDIRGSFLGTTADSILFPDGKEFSATNPEAPPILTVNVQQPIGLEFQGRERTISQQGNLAVDSGQNLALVGGNLIIDGGRIVAPGGRVELGGLSAAGEIGINADGSLSFPDGIERADVTLTDAAEVNVSAGGSGSITVNARNIDVLEGSSIEAGISSNLGSVESQAEDIILNATDAIAVDNSFVFNQVSENATGNGGDLFIETGELTISNGGQVGVLTLGAGNTGNLTVRASESVKLIGTSADKRFSSGIFAQTQDIGAAGNITIDTGKLIVRDGGVVSSDTFSEGPGGTLTVTASESVELRGTEADGLLSGLFSGTSGTGTAGDLTITTGRLSVSGDGARVLNSTSGVGDAGNLTIATGTLIIQDGGQASTITSGKGNAGNVTVTASESVALEGNAPDSQFPSILGAQVAKEGEGNAGDMTIETGRLSIRDGTQVNNSTFGVGDAGNLIIRASNVEVIGESADGQFDSGIHAQVEIGAEGNAKDILIEAERLTLRDGGQVSAATFGVGNAGNLTVRASEVELIGTAIVGQFPSRLRVRVEPGGEGDAGNLMIETERLIVRDGADVTADTAGTGNAGSLLVRASDLVEVVGRSVNGFPSNLTTSVNQGAVGNAGNLTIETGQLILRDGGQVSASTSGEGDGGNLTVRSSESVELIGSTEAGEAQSGLFAQVGRGGGGDARDLVIQTRRLSIRDGAQVNATTFGIGDAGNLTVRASEVELIGTTSDGQFPSAVQVRVEPGGQGDAGDLTIETERLSVRDGARVAADTTSEGNGGSLLVRASDSVEVLGRSVIGFPSILTTSVNQGAVGNAGDLTIETGQLILRDSGQISASTSGEGDGGNLTVRSSESVELIGSTEAGKAVSGFFANVRESATGNGGQLRIETERLLVRDGAEVAANTLQGSTGDGGSIIIDPNTVIIRDGAQIAVNSDGSGIGGNIDLQAGSLTLDKGTITAETASNQGGDINLTISDLLTLRNNSQITATAGTNQGEGDGGNITIDAPFIIAFPNEDSNITANAFEGNGGNITININGIFGIEFRDQQTPLSDITASSEFGQQGEVEINTSGIDPTRGLNNLPQEATETEVAQSCQETASQSTLEFFDIGRGGLPPTPEDLFSSETVIAEWIPLDLADDKVQEQTLDEIVSESEFTTSSLLKLSCHSK